MTNETVVKLDAHHVNTILSEYWLQNTFYTLVFLKANGTIQILDGPVIITMYTRLHDTVA